MTVNQDVIDVYTNAILAALGKGYRSNHVACERPDVMEDVIKFLMLALGYPHSSESTLCNGGSPDYCDRCKLSDDDTCILTIMDNISNKMCSDHDYYVRVISSGDVLFGPCKECECYNVAKNLSGVEVVGHI